MVTDGGALGINATSGNGNMNSVGWCQCQCTICKWWVTDRNNNKSQNGDLVSRMLCIWGTEELTT